MPQKDRPREVLDGMIHQHYSTPYTGDGATVEFALPTEVLRLSDIVGVYVAGARLSPATPGVAHDFAVRGLTAGYPGSRNKIKFAVAPALAAKIIIDTVGG